MAQALVAAGLEVEEEVGRSAFRCDLALRRPGERDNRVAVLVDTRERLAAAAVTERLLDHPGVLAAAGWLVVHVLTRDWYDDPDAVLARLVAASSA